jgi:hypothetical protein
MDPDEHIIINIDEIKCKYCFDTQDENTALFILPCKCTNPICTTCFKKHIQLNNKSACELCLTPYDEHYLTTYKQHQKCDCHFGMMLSVVIFLIVFFIYVFTINK